MAYNITDILDIISRDEYNTRRQRMSRISETVIKRIGKMDFSRMRDTARMLHKKTGKSTAGC